MLHFFVVKAIYNTHMKNHTHITIIERLNCKTKDYDINYTIINDSWILYIF